ncbi:MAG: fructose-1,6-bisphosphate aldolase/phosphatase [Planctomycetota bacterium]|nr:fructose-1,6-bisphosphate aldolase/phosphatase [Planctomycetota bacterium]
MKVTLSVIKADIGSIGGHLKPSAMLFDRVRSFVGERAKGLLIDHYIGSAGDDIHILMTHTKGVDNEDVHKLAWDAFVAGTETAKIQGLYGAGQDLLKDAFSGNVRGLGPASAEMEIEERPNEPFLLFAADKTDPGAFNLPLYLSYSDPMFCPGLMLAPNMNKGFTYTIMDVSHTEGDRVIELNSPEDIYNIACLLRDNERFVVESIHSRNTGEQCVSVSTSRLHNIAGKYTGKDDPVLLARTQGYFPSTGEVLQPYQIGHFVGGFMRGSHVGPLMPLKLNTGTSFFDGPPLITGAAFCVQDGKLTEPVDLFEHPFWDHVRDNVSRKALDIRRQGFSGSAMLPFNELEYTGIVERLGVLDEKFKVR